MFHEYQRNSYINNNNNNKYKKKKKKKKTRKYIEFIIVLYKFSYFEIVA